MISGINLRQHMLSDKDWMLCCGPVLQASTYQMAVLLMFNNSDSLTVEQIQEHTQLKTVGAI